MHRFHLPPEACRTDVPLLTGPEAHHALRVLRVRAGDRITVLDGAGTVLLCEAQTPQRDTLPLRVIHRELVPPPVHQITLLAAVLKGKSFETVLQKATELGVSRIVPLVTQRTVAQPHDEAAGKVAKWERVVLEAVKQCGNPWLPQVNAPVTPTEYFAQAEACDLALVASLAGDGRHPREYFREFATARNRAPQTVAVWVGPEGDFTPEEYTRIREAGVQPITLGPLVLRAETAALYCLAVVSYELQSRSS